MSLPDSGPLVEVCEGFVLAGGRSSRMGQDKSLIDLQGTPLIEHAIQALRTAGVKVRVAGARSDLSSFASSLPDDPAYPGLGPLSGICAALEGGTARFAVFLPVDLPLMPASLISYLIHHAQFTESTITVASIGGFVETFPVVIDRGAIPVLKAILGSENRNCLTAFRTAAEALARPMSIVPVEFLIQTGQVSDSRGLPPREWFLSINAPEDLVRAEDSVERVAKPPRR